MSNNTNNNEERSEGPSYFKAGALGLTAAALIGGAAYLLSSSKKKEEEQRDTRETVNHRTMHPASSPRAQSSSSVADDGSAASFLSDMMSRVMFEGGRRRDADVPENPVITNLNSLLSDIHVRFIRLKEFDIHYKVFDAVFHDLHSKMKQVDLYYKKHSSTVQFAGSHFDNLRIKKPDEFDMDIVIGLPLNIRPNLLNPADSDIVLEAKAPGFVQLRMGTQFLKLPMRDNEEWLNNRAAYDWKDDCNYLLRSKFIQWFESVVNRALDLYTVRNNNRPVIKVGGVDYTIDVSKSGPAMTLLIHSRSTGFKMDVDLVPALKFPESRWPISNTYREIPSKCKKDYWMVVPKPNKDSPIQQDQMRSWRIALHNQERELMYNSYNLRQTIRLIKKLRDSLGMNKIASYYIKTLFFWEIIDIDSEQYWQNNPAVLFKHMVGKFHQALVRGEIPYFWNRRNNLIGGVPKHILNQYADKILPLIQILQDPSKYKLVAKFLLTPAEFADYNARFLHIYAEELARRKKAKSDKQVQADADAADRRSSSSSPSKKGILGLSALFCGLLAVLFATLDRHTTHKILSIFGLGWLVPIENNRCTPRPKVPKCTFPEPPKEPANTGKCTCNK
ncbi:cyclic GMP-AMP synthase-like receptor [Anticarsia gemmatalis]|uniref:cyclic GMP-AMP synthase-like receptor n=1 Tax=Anticarsia gemmatalis TaxID=129554 RepID=UPI003F77204F